jgi:hypothetical protein
MKLFHRSDEGRTPLYLDGIQAIWPVGSHCAVTLTGSTEDIYLAESAREVAETCGYNAAPAVNTDASLILAGAIREEYDSAQMYADRTNNHYRAGYADGLLRAIEIAEGKP